MIVNQMLSRALCGQPRTIANHTYLCGASWSLSTPQTLFPPPLASETMHSLIIGPVLHPCRPPSTTASWLLASVTCAHVPDPTAADPDDTDAGGEQLIGATSPAVATNGASSKDCMYPIP